MGVRHIGLLMVVAALASGCAGARSRQDMARLQSQVNLLDERVTQLERANLGALSSAPLGAAEADLGMTVGSAAPSSKSASSEKKAPAKTSLKPSTREIQQALKNAGFYQGSVDGKMGPQTREAIKEFQRVHGLNDDGVVGKQTWAKLKAYADLSSASGEATAAEVLK